MNRRFAVLPAEKRCSASVLIAVAFAALSTPANARAAPVFVFDQPSATPNDRVTVRTAARRLKPLQPFRIYLVRADVAGEVRSRLDPRVNFVGSRRAGPERRRADDVQRSAARRRRVHARLLYGRTFKVQHPAQLIERYRRGRCCASTRRSRAPDAPQRESAARPAAQHLVARERPPLGRAPAQRHLHGAADRVDADGSIGNKLLWATTPAWSRPTLSASGSTRLRRRYAFSG